LVEDLVLKLKEERREQLRKDQSIVCALRKMRGSMAKVITNEGLTKISIASVSPFQFSVTFLSSSSDLSKYMENKPSDLSTDLGSSGGS